jgi:hypothetical protein
VDGRTHRLEHLTAEDFAFDGQLPTLIVGEENSALAEFFFEDLVSGAEIFDDFLMLTVAPAGQDGEQELPGLEDEVHGGPDADVATSIASGLEGGL